MAIQARPFDAGEDGTVWYTDRKSVVKAFHRFSNYDHERECYQRLEEAGIRQKILEFNIPKLINFSDQYWVIEMGTVFPPYILDFGKAHLFDPQWPEHVLEEWNEKMVFWWGDDVKRVRRAIYTLQRFGIWYYDAKPGNVMLENWSPRLDDD